MVTAVTVVLGAKNFAPSHHLRGGCTDKDDLALDMGPLGENNDLHMVPIL